MVLVFKVVPIDNQYYSVEQKFKDLLKSFPEGKSQAKPNEKQANKKKAIVIHQLPNAVSLCALLFIVLLFSLFFFHFNAPKYMYMS